MRSLEHKGYLPSHPWYYKLGGRILSVNEIQPSTGDVISHYRKKRDKDAQKARQRLLEIEDGIRRELQSNIDRYNELVEKGLDALSESDRKFTSGEEMMPLWVALSLKHNHISWSKAQIKLIEEMKSVSPIQLELQL